MKFCYKCGAEFLGLTQPATKEVCLKCFSDLHCCMNCLNYDVHRSNACKVDSETVVDKQRANFCEQFEFLSRKSFQSTVQSKPKEDFKKAFEKLFKK